MALGMSAPEPSTSGNPVSSPKFRIVLRESTTISQPFREIVLDLMPGAPLLPGAILPGA
ncbi:hypothetical protein [Methanosarcina sp.]|uniref:hypothetical protein n=1 Tax=Methanosarcina sp. TaxID=2213 RepID=UPI003C779E4B